MIADAFNAVVDDFVTCPDKAESPQRLLARVLVAASRHQDLARKSGLGTNLAARLRR